MDRITILFLILGTILSLALVFLCWDFYYATSRLHPYSSISHAERGQMAHFRKFRAASKRRAAESMVSQDLYDEVPLQPHDDSRPLEPRANIGQPALYAISKPLHGQKQKSTGWPDLPQRPAKTYNSKRGGPLAEFSTVKHFAKSMGKKPGQMF